MKHRSIKRDKKILLYRFSLRWSSTLYWFLCSRSVYSAGLCWEPVVRVLKRWVGRGGLAEGEVPPPCMWMDGWMEGTRHRSMSPRRCRPPPIEAAAACVYAPPRPSDPRPVPTPACLFRRRHNRSWACPVEGGRGSEGRSLTRDPDPTGRATLQRLPTPRLGLREMRLR